MDQPEGSQIWTFSRLLYSIQISGKPACCAEEGRLVVTMLDAMRTAEMQWRRVGSRDLLGRKPRKIHDDLFNISFHNVPGFPCFVYCHFHYNNFHF